MADRNSDGKVDVGIVTVRQDEADAVHRRFPFRKVTRATRTFEVAEIRCTDGSNIRIVHVRCEGQGPDEANRTTAALIEEMAPQWVILVGIAGALPDDDLSLGDVAVSSLVYDTKLSASKPSGEREFAARQCQLNAKVRDLIAYMPSILGELGPWNELEGVGEERPVMNVRTAKVSGSKSWMKKVRRSLTIHFGPSSSRELKPRIGTVPFASGTQLEQDPCIVSQWSAGARDVKAVEMELSGVLLACEKRYEGNSVPAFSIRGLSDVIGLTREAKWTSYACETAASFAFALIRSGVLVNWSATLRKGVQMRHPIRRRVGGQSDVISPGDAVSLLSLGRLSIEAKATSRDQRVNPSDVFVELAASTRGRQKLVVGWNVRPVPRLGIIHLAYLQQLCRLSDWGFSITIVIYDLFTSKEFLDIEIDTMAAEMERRMLRFRGIKSGNIKRLSKLLAGRRTDVTIRELFRLATPSQEGRVVSDNDPAASLDNLVCMAVERWETYTILLAGGRDANDFWTNYRTFYLENPSARKSLALVLNFPKLTFGIGELPEDLHNAPHEEDTEETICLKLSRMTIEEKANLWYAVVAPCLLSGELTDPDEAALPRRIYECFRNSRFITT